MIPPSAIAAHDEDQAPVAWRKPVDAWSDSGSPVCLVRHVPARFRIEAFSRHGIVCPAEVRRSVLKRQAEFFHGRLAARHAMAALGCPASQVGIGASREPVWPEGLVGSITHSGDLAAAVVLRRGPWHGVGIDIEQRVDRAGRDALLAIVLDASELAILRTLADGPDLDRLISIVFSAKESLFKAAHARVGRYFGFEAARLAGLDAVRGTLVLRLEETLCADFRRHQPCEIGFGDVDERSVITWHAW